MNDRSEREGSMKSLRTSLRLLMEFMGDQPDFGVSELTERTGLPKSQVSKILSAFHDHGLLSRDPKTRRYAVGLRAYALGSRYVKFDRLSREALPIMRGLVERSGHSVRLSVMEGEDVLYLLGIEGPLFVDTGWRAGTWLPLHATSAGRVLLAFLPEARVEALIANRGMAAVTPETVTDPAVLRRILVQVRSRGFSMQRNETMPGLGTIGVPILGGDQAVIGVLGIAFPVHLVPRERDPALIEMLHQSARVLSQRMGSAVYPFGGIAQGGKPPRAAARAERVTVAS